MLFETLQDFLNWLAELPAEQTPDERSTAIGEALAAATPEQLATFSTEIEAATDALLDGDLTDETLATLEQLAEASGSIQYQIAMNDAAEADRATRAAELAAQIRGPVAGDEGEGGEGETPPGEGDEPVEDPAEGDPDAEPVEGVTPVEQVPVAAAGRVEPTRALRPAARRPAAQLPVRAAAVPGALPDSIDAWGLTAGANVEGMTHGARVRSADDLARVFVAALQASAGYRGPKVKVPLASIGGSPEAVGYSEDRILREGDVRGNMRKVAQIATPEAIMASARRNGTTPMQALAASGGICAPTPVTYDEPMLGTDARPVRDQMLTRFGADRGGVRLFPALFFEDMEGATGFWTNANDINPVDPAVKPCLTMTCPEDEEFFVYAVTQCLEIGVFRSRYFSEQVEAWIRGAAIANARAAEIRLLESIAASSTQVTYGQTLGTIPTILAGLDHARAVIQSSNRLPSDLPLRWGHPSWLLENMATDMARRLPGTGSVDEQFALADAQINRWFTSRNIQPVELLDGESGQMYPRQGDGPVQGFPSTAVTYLYPDGAHLFLDGGELNIGVIRDSGLVETNDYRMFSETFEGHAFHGVESWRYTFDICPDGSTSAAVDIDPCSTGS